ncbi:MAG TPA: precorrin-6y C5,15-methyltransferase (decarboxylating) subunit CbiE [Desulfobacteria bacterium]|nr:precorrin-6y C5,15-methyltransferase (decarboxylating) subunit CbiE [Desulfobacteria bacterium]
MANLIRVVGIGPGSPEYITPAAEAMVRDSDVLIGGERALKAFDSLNKKRFLIKNNLKEMVDFINKHRIDFKVAVLASGDPSFFGILEFLKRNFSKSELEVTPGISSAQLACARLCISWHDAAFFSVHGRNTEGLCRIAREFGKVIVLTDPKNTPGVIARGLVREGLSARKVYVCENLSTDDEGITEWEICSVPESVGPEGCVMVISDE